MNVKALAAVVGTLSLSALATGCASTKSAQTADKTAEQSGAEKGTSAECAKRGASSTPEKTSEGGCKASNTSCSTK